jgi:hypothetical protein
VEPAAASDRISPSPRRRTARSDRDTCRLSVPLSGFQPNATITPGIVLATHQTQQLLSAEGVPETLTDAIPVTTSGTLSGESGGPAIDAAGKVVGVIEGGGLGVTTLTPVADLRSLH